MPNNPRYSPSNPRVGRFSSGLIKLGNNAQSQALANEGIISHNNSIFLAQQKQEQKAIASQEKKNTQLDAALSAAAEINLQNAGALNTNVFGQLAAAGSAALPAFTIKPPVGSQVLAGGKFKLPDGRIINPTSPAPIQTKAQPTPDQLIEQETKRSKSIIEGSFGEKDPISEELNKKLGKLEDELASYMFNRQPEMHAITSGSGAEAGGAGGIYIQDYIVEHVLKKDVSIERGNELRNAIAKLQQSQVAINSFKAELQIKKVTTDYLTELKGQGKTFGEQDALVLMQKAKEITAKQRHYTRGDELYDDNSYNTYMKEFQGDNDFFDWRHTEMSLGNAINSVYNQVNTAEGPEREELIGVLDQLNKYNKKHESSNKDAYDHYYGGSKQYYKEKTPWKTYLDNQVGGGVTEGLYNYFGTMVSGTQDLLGYHSAAFATRQGKDKYFTADMLQADLDRDGQITEKDKDIHGQYQYIGKNVTYIKAGDGPDKKGKGDIGYIGSSVLGASVRTLSEMLPTLLITKRMMAAGVGMRLATFVPVTINSSIRSYEENRKWFKDKGTAALVSGIQGIIEGGTESIVPDISYFMGNKALGRKALSGFSRRYFTAQTLVPEFTTLSRGAKNLLLGTGYAGLALGKQTLQEGFEEELSMFANYVLDKQLKTQDDPYLNTEGKLGRPQELDDSSVEGFFKSIARTFVESAAAGLLMSATAIGSSRTQDRNYMRFNIANNPEQFKAELKTQLQEKKITQDQYNKGILETGRLAQLQEQATSTMMNLVDSENLLLDHDKQYEYFSQLLNRDDLLQKVDYNSLSETEKEEYVKKVESVEKDIDKFENLARQYANMPKEEKEGILAKMVEKNLETVKNTNNPAVLLKNLEAITDAIEIGEKTGKGSEVMISGRQQVREALIGQIERLQTVEDNGNTVYENQLLNSPIESSGESMQISNGVRLAALVMQNSQLISPQVQTQLLEKVKVASETAQNRIQNLSRREQKKVAARELARVELIHPGTAFNADALELLFKLDLTAEEHSDVIQEASVITAREKETLKDEDILQPQDEDVTLNSLLKSIEAVPEEIQVENEMGNLETKRNEEKNTRRRRAVMSIPRAKSKEQARGRVKAIFKVLGYSNEDINKALEDLNKVFDNQEVTEPGEIYNRFLKVFDPNMLRSLPDRVVSTSEDILSEEPVVEETVTEAPTQSEISDQEYTDFIDKGIVSKERINAIANKVKNNEQLSPREKEIFTDKTAEVNAELVALAKNSTTLEEDKLFGTNEELAARRQGATEVVVEAPTIDVADEVITETPIPVVDPLDGLEVVSAKSIDSPNLVTTIPTVFTNSNAVVQSSIIRTISQSLESFNLKLVDMFSFIRETLGESAMPTLENIYNNVTEALKTNNLEAIARLKEDYLAVFSGSTFATGQLEYIWKEQYVKGKPDASIPFQDLAYVTNGQFATAYQGDEVIVTGVKKATGEVLTYTATVTGKVNQSNQIEVKTRNGVLVYIKKSNLQTIIAKPINVRANFNQTNSIMMTAVDRTTGEIAKFNSNGERDAQGDTQLNTFVPQANPTMIEVRKSLASGQPVAHTLPIHAGARINTAFAYTENKVSVYLTASVTGINTDIQTIAPQLEVPAQTSDAKADEEYLGTPEISKIEIGTINNIIINGDLYQFKTKDGLISGVMLSSTEFRIDGISANEVGKGQGSKMFESLISYLKSKGVTTLKTESAGEGAIKMHNKAVDKGLLIKVKEDGRFAIFTINTKSTQSTTDAKADNIKNRKRKDLFPDKSEFAQVVGNSEAELENEIKKARYIDKNETKAKELEAELERRQSKISSYKEVNGIGIAEYTNPKNGLVDVIMTGTSDNDYVGYVRIYTNSIVDSKVVVTPTERWTSKMENKSQNKANIKTMLGEVQKLLPAGHEYTEKTNISLDGLKTYAQQLKYGYEVLLDKAGNPVVNQIILNKASVSALQNAKSDKEINDLYKSYENLTRAEYNEIKAKINALMPEARVLPFNETNGTISINLPVLKSTAQSTDAVADIEKRRQDELDSVDISKGGKVPLEGYEEFYKNVNERYDAELATLEQQEVGSGVVDVNSKLFQLAYKSHPKAEKAVNARVVATGMSKLDALKEHLDPYPSQSEKGISRFEELKNQAKKAVEQSALEQPALEQPAFEPEVTTNLSKDELAILSFDTSQIDNLEISENPINQSDAKEIEDAASCKLL